MKYIDKFLKILNTDRNTFATYLFTLLTVYLSVDRIVEMLLMIFTGVSYSYWGPIQYTLALACPMLAYLFSGPSKFATSKKHKVTLFYLYVIGLYIIAISMFTQWLNMGAWLFLLSVPNYTEIITEFSDIVTPAMVSISLYLPLTTIYPLFHWLYFGVNDSKDRTRSIWDYGGINLSTVKDGIGPYTCELYFAHDFESGKSITFPETSRYQSTFVCGGSGSGKTSLVFEPFMARDLEKKFFFREAAKELGFTALKTKIAYINAPYDNEYMNYNFSLKMLSPSTGKEDIFKAYFKKLTLGTLGNDTIYKDLGLTLMSPDCEVINHIMDVCDNFSLNYYTIDPNSSQSIGLNPFIYDDPSKIAVTISSALKAMYRITHDDIGDAYRDDMTMQAIENLSMILKEMYPKMNDGLLPNMEDMLKMFTNFDLIEKMCEIMAHDEELKEKYNVQLTYFKKNFYHDAPGRQNIEKYLFLTVTQLDNLLRIPGVKNILCNRHENLDFDKMLANGEITFICTRRGDLGASAHRAFGLFFLISMQNAVFRRPGSENSRIPHFLYIDEFPDFICKETEAIFTMYRKYKIGTTVSSQTLSQLSPADLKENFRNSILSNCVNKIFTGQGSIEELEWWSEEFGTRREWTYSNSIDMEKLEYDKKWGNVKWEYVKFFKPGKFQTFSAKDCAYKIRGSNGKPMVGQAKLNYLESKYKEMHKLKNFDFGKYSDGVTTETEDESDSSKLKNSKFNLKDINFKDKNDEYNPIQSDLTDSKYLFDNEDAIIVDLKNKNKL